MYGYDFTTSGPKCGPDWLKSHPEEKYELKENRALGPGPDDETEGKILTRMIRGPATAWHMKPTLGRLRSLSTS